VSTIEPICVQIAALGGQGGGVLAEWLADAADIAGYPAQVTSIPGVAQRTGATTYYLEVFPDKEPDGKPVFCLFPDEDGLDLMAALEPMEAARALNLGLISERTTVITADKRIYSTAEKSVAGNGAVKSEALIEPLRRAAKDVVALDIEGVVGRPGGQGNAALLGAIQASGVLPITDDDCRQAIRAKGVAVPTNLADFEAGLSAARGGKTGGAETADGLTYEEPPQDLEADLQKFPKALRPIVGHGFARLADYQDNDYARLYGKRLAALPGLDPDGMSDDQIEAFGETAKRLAAWMSYEDVIRVAQLKTRPGRLAGIRGNLGLGDDDRFRLIDFLKPGREEVASLLPPGLGGLLMKLPSKGGPGGMKLRLATSRPFAFGMLRLLGRLRPWRPKTYRYAREQAAIETWLRAVTAALETDSDIARRTAELAVLARGYGGVRERGLTRIEKVLEGWERRLIEDAEGLSREIDRMLDQARNDPDADIAA